MTLKDQTKKTIYKFIINKQKIKEENKGGLTCIVWVFPLLVTPYANTVPVWKPEEFIRQLFNMPGIEAKK